MEPLEEAMEDQFEDYEESSGKRRKKLRTVSWIAGLALLIIGGVVAMNMFAGKANGASTDTATSDKADSNDAEEKDGEKKTGKKTAKRKAVKKKPANEQSAEPGEPGEF